MTKKFHDSHPKHERTLTVIKPDGIQRSLIGEVVSRYEKIGLKLVAMKMLKPTPEHIKKHYTLDPEWLRKVGEKSISSASAKGADTSSMIAEEVGSIVLKCLTEYMTSGPVIAMVWEGAHAVSIVRKITGGTEPLSSDVGTIRGDFMLDSYQMSNADGRAVRNLVHASGTTSEAEQEIAHWFSKDELMDYTHVQEKILYE